MNIWILFLLIINIVMIVTVFFLLRKISQNNYRLKEEIKEIKKSEPILALNKNIGELTDKLDQLSTDNKKEWFSVAEDIEEEEKKLEYFEAAVRRFPSDKELIVKIREILDPLANDDDNLLVRREALMRLRDHANRFVENAPLEDFDYALQFREEIINSMANVVEKLTQLRKENMSNMLTELNNNISILEDNPKNNGTLKEIEQLDRNIDREILSDFPKLQKEYDRLSNSLMKILTNNEKESKESLKSYNKKVLKEAKSVVDKVQNHSEGKVKEKLFGPDNPVNYNKKKNLKKLVDLLSGFDSQKLLPTTENYLRMAESQVFNKLSPEGKKLFTKLMIEES